jgi:hypothetical protein
MTVEGRSNKACWRFHADCLERPDGASAREVGQDRDQLKGLEYDCDNNVSTSYQMYKMCCDCDIKVNIVLTRP